MSSPPIPAGPGAPSPGRGRVPAGRSRPADGTGPTAGIGPADEAQPADGTGSAGGSGASARGRPRSEAADRAILRAATDLLAERGLAGMSMEEVAARAGGGKATVYRRWRSRGGLALDPVMAEFQALQPLPD